MEAVRLAEHGDMNADPPAIREIAEHQLPSNRVYKDLCYSHRRLIPLGVGG